MRLSLAVIVKDELERVNKIISDYAQYFDELAFAVDDEKTLQTLVEKHTNSCIKFYKYTWCDDFSHKRNFLREKLTGDYYFRIDTDDAIINPERIRKVAEEAYKNNYSVVVCYYLYSKDENGNCNAAHYRETIIKNTPNLVWNKAIHENIIPKSLSGYKLHIDESIKIDHQIDFDHSVKSITRNLLYLIKEYNKDRADTDPRTLAYLGRTFFSMKNWDRAIFFLQKHIASSGWDDDRYLSWSYLSEIFNQRNEYKEAIACANEALQERPDYPDAYFKLHDIYFAMKEWEKAIQWGELGFTRKHPRSFIVLDPSAWTWRPAISMAFCYAQQDKWEEALKYFQYAKKLAPNVAWIQRNERYFSEGYALKKFNEDFLKVYAEVKKHDFESAGKLVASLPKTLRGSELIMSLERKHLAPKVWGDNEICFLCPMSVEEWSPKSVAKGIGGSEEAVIHMSKELQRLGYKVTVYTDCAEDEGNYDGVEWIDWHKFNPNDIFSHLVGWRVNIGGYKFKAKNKIIWLHDIPNCLAGISDDEIKGIDKIIVLSNFHKSLLPKNIPDEKVIVSTNGINPDDFVGIEEKREPHRIIYASSYDRGLETILSSWSEIRKRVPDATIHIYYGWNTYDALAGQGMRKNDFKEKMQKLMLQEGVYEHGRVGHKELIREYSKASIFAYPCNYVGEINCIALTKAIASGCVPVTNDFAVMAERNKIGYVSSNENFIGVLIEALTTTDVTVWDKEKYIQDNSWASVAKDWKERVFSLTIPVEISDRHSWIRSHCSKDKKIVDIGCNKGHMFDGWDRKNITSVDIDEYEIENFVRANAEELPFIDKQFDVALLAEIVEHCKNPIKALTEARRVAKQVIVTVPWEHKWTSALLPFSSLEDDAKRKGLNPVELAKDQNPEAKSFYSDDGFKHLYHETFYTPDLLTEHLKRAGFTSIKLYEIRFDEWVWLGAICG